MAGTRVDRRITIVLKEFNDNLNNQTINEYFQLPPSSPTYTLIRTDTLTVEFKLSYIKTYDISHIQLPDDILQLINTYIDKDVLIIFNVIYGTDYPFKPPKWNIQKINAPQPIIKKVDQIINKHNNEYNIDWSPSIRIEKDTLYMIERLTQIDYI
jgi:hypothetical protein